MLVPKDQFTLNTPIMVEGKETTNLELDNPRVRHLKAMDQADGEIGKATALVAALANIPESSVEQMGVDDFKRITLKFASFLKDSA